MIIKDIDGKVLYKSKADSIKEVLEEAARNGIPLRRAQLNNAVITGACLDGAILEKASFQRSLLYKVSFYKARLGGVNFFLADLARASFKDAFLVGAYLRNANLRKTNLDAEVPPLDDHQYISEILWRFAQTEPQRDFAARVRIETYSCWEHFYLLAKKKKVLTWAKKVLSRWIIYRKQIQSIERLKI